ncbi:Hypothetical protein NCS54_00620700 [Fusarium falciforme]|uniref:Hypothetical protein n=1 Tax=Fusarium falciforme TaxID=195108 RepID=UPI002301785C|nr:Hypothetical protein NCS54_00620700 [Fusarium falciforme]WAO88845.1 Hypothetical protein NCS54_00620700 [Fusarium falciforme]
MSAARTFWAFAQVWFNEFPDWNTKSDQLSLWTSSYGGMYGPHFFSYFQDQNKLIKNETPSLENTTTLNLATLGLDEPGIDYRAMARGYPMFGHNNTYGIQVLSEDVYEELMTNIVAPDEGCYALIDRCRALVSEGDPERFGTNETVNEACVEATNMCFGVIQGAYGELSDRSPFDVTVSNVTVLPWHYMDNYPNQAWVQQELGVPLNFTADWGLIAKVFLGETGDSYALLRTKIANHYNCVKDYKGDYNLCLRHVIRDASFTCNTRDLLDSYPQQAYAMNYGFPNDKLAYHVIDLVPLFVNVDIWGQIATMFVVGFNYSIPAAAEWGRQLRTTVITPYLRYFSSFARYGNTNGTGDRG